MNDAPLLRRQRGGDFFFLSLSLVIITRREQRLRAEREREDHLCIMTSSFEAPWIEKYRPELLSDVVGNAEAVSRLAAISQVKKKKKMMMIIADECQ